MRSVFRYLWLPIYRHWVLRHIQREQYFVGAGMRLKVPPGVFHPGVFFSSEIFVDFLQKIDFQGKKVIDVGTGSGFLALFAAYKGAIVTAIDINPLAVETAQKNASILLPPPSFLQSDLFDEVPRQVFDFVLVNPPYYARAPRNDTERAFFAGEHLEYFEKFFAQAPAFCALHSRVWMILSEDCDLVRIGECAARHGFLLRKVFEKKKWGERFWVIEAERPQPQV